MSAEHSETGAHTSAPDDPRSVPSVDGAASTPDAPIASSTRPEATTPASDAPRVSQPTERHTDSATEVFPRRDRGSNTFSNPHGERERHGGRQTTGGYAGASSEWQRRQQAARTSPAFNGRAGSGVDKLFQQTDEPDTSKPGSSITTDPKLSGPNERAHELRQQAERDRAAGIGNGKVKAPTKAEVEAARPRRGPRGRG